MIVETRFRLLAKVPLEQARVALAVAGFVLAHFMHGIMYRIIAKLLGQRGKFLFPGGCAPFRFGAHFQILLRAVGQHFAQQLGKAGGMGVIGARSAAALKAEQALLAGGASRFIRTAQETLLTLIAGVEAHIDYPDEIDETEATKGLWEGLTRLVADLRGAVDERGARILREGLRVALYGLPNAGKSTLFNALLGEDRAIVTDVPGTTRDVLEGAFMLNGLNVTLMDTAGLRDSDDQVERIGVTRARQAVARADVALLLVDATVPPDEALLALLSQDMGCPAAVLLNKEDDAPVLSAQALEPWNEKSGLTPFWMRMGTW